MDRLLVMQSDWETALVADAVGSAAFRTWAIETDDEQILDVLAFNPEENGPGAFVWEGHFGERLDPLDPPNLAGGWRLATREEVFRFARGDDTWHPTEGWYNIDVRARRASDEEET